MSGIYFNGRFYIKPAVVTFVDDTALTPVGLVGANVIGMLGPAKDGEPNTAFLITSLSDATDIFVEGPLVDGIAMAFSNGAQYIWATRIGGTYSDNTFTSPPLQAYYSADEYMPFKLLSNSFGDHANSIKVTFKAGTVVAPTKAVDIKIEAFSNTIETFGIFNNVMKIASTASETVTFTIDKNGSNYQLVIDDGAGNSTAPINLETVATILDLKTRIEAAIELQKESSWNPELSEIVITALDESASPIEMDMQTIAVTVGSFKYLSSTVKKVYDWLRSGAQPIVTAEDPDAIFTTVLDKDLSLFNAADPGTTFTLTGGSFGSVNATSYEGALSQVYEDLDLDLMVPIVDNYLSYSLTGSADAIFNYTFEHCKAMSTTGSEERICLAGYHMTSTDDSVDDLKDYAFTYNSPYFVICSPRITTYDTRGVLKTFNGSYTAASIAGLIASFPVGEPITNKVVSNIRELSTIYKNREILDLIDNGILIIEKVRGVGYKVVQGITSWVGDDNYNRKEISVRLVTNYVAKNCRENLKTFIGRKNSLYILETIKGSLIQVLKGLEEEGVIVGTAAYPAFRNMSLRAEGDTVRVWFECSPVLPINYIAINIHATVFKATI